MNLFKNIKKPFTKHTQTSIVSSANQISHNPAGGINNESPSFRKTLPRTYHSIDLATILFLSKRGMSRSPFAQEVMRDLLQSSPYFGRIRISSRGVNTAYDNCHVDSRMQSYASKLGLILHSTAQFATVPELANASLVITMDADSEDFVKIYNHAIRGQVRPLATFLPQGSEPYFLDPFERGDDIDVDDRYENIINSIKFSCEKLLLDLPNLAILA